jgi:archaellum component FlaC
LNELGLIFEGIISPLLEWIKEDQTGPAIAGVIVIVGFLIISAALAQTIQEAMLISKARWIVGDGDEEQFAKHYNTMDQDLKEIEKINFAWSEFSETLFRPKFDEEKNLISPCENTVRPQEYFNIRNLDIGPNFAKVFPSVFVGIGLSLTFLGLIAALSEAVVAINASAGDTNSIQAAIANLLQISSAKFYASLFALFTSIVMTISLRLMSWFLNASLNKLNQSIEASVRYLGPEKLSITANELLSEQLVQLQTFNTDLAFKIGEQVQLSLSESLAPVVEKLNNMGGDMAAGNIKAIKDIAEEVTKGIQGSAAGAMDRVAETLDSISAKLGGLSDTLGGALSNFDSDFTQMLDGLKQSLKDSADGVSAGINDSMNHMSEGIGKTAVDVSQIIGGLKTTMESLANTGADISKQGGEELRRQVEVASKQASEQMSQAGQELATGFQQSTQELVATMAGMTAQLKQLEAGLLGLPGQLGEVNIKLSASATQIENASDQFGTVTSGIRGVIEPLAQYASDTRQAISEIMEAMKIVSSQVGEASTGISGAVESLSTEVSGQLKRLDGADEQLARLLLGIEDSTTRVLGEVNRFVSEVDSGFASSIGMLQESIGEFEEVVDSVGKIVKETRKG